jgi:hypothetical protein
MPQPGAGGAGLMPLLVPSRGRAASAMLPFPFREAGQLFDG